MTSKTPSSPPGGPKASAARRAVVDLSDSLDLFADTTTAQTSNTTPQRRTPKIPQSQMKDILLGLEPLPATVAVVPKPTTDNDVVEITPSKLVAPATPKTAAKPAKATKAKVPHQVPESLLDDIDPDTFIRAVNTVVQTHKHLLYLASTSTVTVATTSTAESSPRQLAHSQAFYERQVSMLTVERDLWRSKYESALETIDSLKGRLERKSTPPSITKKRSREDMTPPPAELTTNHFSDGRGHISLDDDDSQEAFVPSAEDEFERTSDSKRRKVGSNGGSEVLATPTRVTPSSIVSGGYRSGVGTNLIVETPRTKAERELLPGVECEECREFYDAMYGAGNYDQRKKSVDNCSRHRKNLIAPPTPPGYWDLSFDGDQSPRKEK